MRWVASQTKPKFLRPKQAAEFSFLLGLPTLGGACVYKSLKSGDEIASLGAVPSAQSTGQLPPCPK